MTGINLIDSFSEFKDTKNIDRPTLIKIIEDVFKTIIRKKYGSDENFDIIVNDQTGDLEIFRRRLIVEDDELEDSSQIGYSEAILIDEDYAVGEEVYDEVDIKSFGHRDILSIKQILSLRVKDIKNKALVDAYSDRIGDTITAEIHQIFGREILLLDMDGNEIILSKSDQIPGERFRKGDNIQGVITSVEAGNKKPLIQISRSSPIFLERLMESEIPEVMDGIIVIKKIAREAGVKSKIVVESYDDRVDPVGTCVGARGSRIKNITRDIHNETIDIINFTNNQQLLIQRALSPAKINSVTIEGNNASVFLDSDQISLAIGSRGVNIRLATELTGFNINMYSDDQVDEVYDFDIEDFSDEIDGWVIDELKKIGCDTALSVLDMSVDELVKRANLDIETIYDVQRILNSEFEKNESSI